MITYIFREGSKWYKFDDGDVTEVMMQDDEELKNQCWGGEYLSEVKPENIHFVKNILFIYHYLYRDITRGFTRLHILFNTLGTTKYLYDLEVC